MNTYFWTWRGTFFGFRQENQLFTHDGVEVGRFDGDEIYGSDGYYLGEIGLENRLITNRSKKSYRRSSFTPSRITGIVSYVGYVGYVMYAGYEDFPHPEAFR